VTSQLRHGQLLILLVAEEYFAIVRFPDDAYQKLRKYMQICYSYAQNTSVLFFWDTVYILQWFMKVQEQCIKCSDAKMSWTATGSKYLSKVTIYYTVN